MKKFWNWKTKNNDEHVLFLNGTIAEESWFDDDVTPRLFKSELENHKGNITVWINSPGGDCIAAAQIYNMLIDHEGEVVIKIDGIAASAASVIAMAGTKVLMSPVSMMMIHNPMTFAFGNKDQMKQAISMLDEVKESIMNAYEIKTGQSRQKLSNMMDGETWMNVHKAIELGFCDGILERASIEDMNVPVVADSYSKVVVENSLKDKITEKCQIKTKNNTTKSQDLIDRLNLIKNWR
ncbi:TPA: Clp protease ClpP [Streptococcus suis]|nr:Clp protease ClpP [Streptococcus suis]